MFEFLKKYIKKRKEKKDMKRRRDFRPERVWCTWEHREWGDTIGWADFKSRSISGHLTPKPKVGDEFRSIMNSGKIARFEIIKVEDRDNINDMFFATVKDIGYADGTSCNFG